MTRKDFIFLQGFPVGRQKKEQEIEQARARSHAAKVVHRRTKEIAHQFQQDLVAVDEKHTVHANNWLLRHFWSGTYPTVYAGFHGMRIDPFSRVPSSYDRDIAQVIDFAAQIFVPSNNIVADLLDVTDVCAGCSENMTNSNFFHAGMAMLHAIWEQMQAPGSRHLRRMLLHKGEALSTVRRKLSDGFLVDDVTLCALLFLAMLERAMGNFDAFDMHKRNIASIVHMRGGLRGIQNGSIVKGVVMQFDCLWALPTGITMYPEERDASEPTLACPSTSRELQNMIRKTPFGFQDLIYQRKLSTNTIVILGRAAVAGITSSDGAYLRQVAKRRQRRRKYNDFWEACPCLGDLNKNSPNLDQMVTLALIVYVCLAFSPAQDNTCMFQDARLVLSETCRQYRVESSSERECLLWSYVIATDAWKTGAGSDLPIEGKALREQMRLLFPEARERTLLDVILGKFFWSGAMASKSAVYVT